MAALGAHQVHLLVRVVDALARLQGDERDFTALVVGQVDEAAAPAQALLPGQHPATKLKFHRPIKPATCLA
ncbi:hypothetical protein D3C81_1164820 [compost metagenome]